MSLISQTTSYTTPGTYTYTIPQGVGSLEFHLWGAGGANGGSGPSVQVGNGYSYSQVPSGTKQVQIGTEKIQSGTEQVQTGTKQVQTGTKQVQTGTKQVQTGTKQVQTGTKRTSYVASVVDVDSKGNPTRTLKTVYVDTPVYSTEPVYRTDPVFSEVAVYADEPVYGTSPIYSDQPIYTTQTIYDTVFNPTYATATGGVGGSGAAGGYSSRRIQVTAGDVIVISVGSAGIGSIGGQSTASSNFNGGNGGVASNGGSGGGGGAATVITVNGTIVAVAAGGAGGGAGGVGSSPTVAGASGTPGTAATISGVGAGTQGSGLSSVDGPATGGGGGAGFYAGSAGLSGNSGGGGQGGVCYGTVIQGGNGTTPGGNNISVYPGRNVGAAGQSGAALLVFNKSFNINVKRSGNWTPVNSAWVKVGGSWKELLNGWTKVSGVWQPLISADAVVGSENLTTPAITYSLSADAASISEGDSVEFTLTTTGIAAGTLIPYTATGIDAVDLAAGALQGNFIIGTTDSITFTPRPNNTTNGTRTLRVSVDNSTAVATCSVLDTSLTPVYLIVGNVATINEGGTVRFTLSTSYVDSGTVIPYSISGVSSDDLSVGSLSGNFTVGSAETATFTLASDSLTEGAESITITLTNTLQSARCTINDTSTTPIPVYTLTTSAPSVNEGGTVTFTLSTANVAVGTTAAYRISGISSADLSSGSMTGSFIVGSVDTASFTLASDVLTEGAETLTLELVSKGITSSCSISDTSRAPVPFTGRLAFSGSGSWTVPDYVTSATFTICGGGGGGGGSDQGGDNDNLWGVGGNASNNVTRTIAVTPGQVFAYSIGAGGNGANTWKKHYPDGGTGGTSTVTLDSTTILSATGGVGGVSRSGKSFSPGKGSSNGGASGGKGSTTGYGSDGSPGQSGFGVITWAGIQPG
jgi:hypothetical protein